MLVLPVPVVSARLTNPGTADQPTRIYDNNAVVSFDEMETITLTCAVNGSYPAPKVKVTLDNQDQNNLFPSTTRLWKTGSSKGLREMYYSANRTNEKFEIRYEMRDSQLKCTANIPNSDFEPVSTSIIIRLKRCKYCYIRWSLTTEYFVLLNCEKKLLIIISHLHIVFFHIHFPTWK